MALMNNALEPQADWRNDEQLIVDLAKSLHEFGATSSDLEDFIVSYTQQLGHQVEVFCSPTSLFLSFEHGGLTRTMMFRMVPGSIDLGKLADVYRLIDGLQDESIPGCVIRDRINEIRNKNRLGGIGLFALSFGTASGTSAGFFGGGWSEALVTGGIGLLLGFFACFAMRRQELRRVLPVASSALAALLASVVSAYCCPISVNIVTLSSLIVLIPGLSITTSISELAQDHLAAGASRLVGALVQLLSIAFGVAVGRTMIAKWVEIQHHTPVPLPSPVFWCFLLIAPIAISILFRARRQDIPWIVFTTALAYFATSWGQSMCGAELGAAFGCFVLGVTSNVLSRTTHRPAQVMLVPSLLILVPGSIGFRAVQAFVDHETVEAVQALFGTMFVAAALVSGLLVANFVVPPRSLHLTPHPKSV